MTFLPNELAEGDFVRLRASVADVPGGLLERDQSDT